MSSGNDKDCVPIRTLRIYLLLIGCVTITVLFVKVNVSTQIKALSCIAGIKIAEKK